MPYCLEHRFIGHLNEIHGDFVSPVTKERMSFTDLHKGITLATLLCLPQDNEKKDPLKFGYRARYPISRKVISEMYGKPISQDTYANWVKAMTRAGVFIFTRELGGNYSIEAGLALDCDLYRPYGLCDENHFPYWFPTPQLNPSTPSSEQSTPSNEPILEQGLPEDTPPIRLDINKLNKPQQVETSENTLLATQENLLEEEEEEDEDPWGILDLPYRYLQWLSIRTNLKGLDEPSSMDIAEAWRCYELTGVDLEQGGAWLTGRQNSPLAGYKGKPNN